MQRDYRISLSQEAYSNVVYLSQYDNDYPVVFTVFDKYVKASGINGYSVKFTGTRTDGLGFVFESTAVGNKVSFTIDRSLTALAGTHKGELIIYDTNGLFFGSANVKIIVEPAAHPNRTIDANVEDEQWIANEIREILDTAKAEVESGLVEVKKDLNYDKTAPQGYILTATNEGNGSTWSPVGLPTDEQTKEAVSEWLDEHPEVTTTVEDGSLTEEKLSDELKLTTIKNYVTPQMYGAKADGVTDDTTAIRNAIASGAKTVFFPKGIYYISETIHIDRSICLKGEDTTSTLGGTIIRAGEFNVLSIENRQVTISDICIIPYTSLSLNDLTSYIGIYCVFNSSQSEIHINNVIVSTYGYGFYFDKAYMCSMKNCRAQSCGIGFYISDATTFVVEKCWALQCSSSGYHLYKVTYSSFLSTGSDGCLEGYRLDTCDTVSFVSCGCEVSNNTPIYITTSDGINFVGFLSYKNNVTNADGITLANIIDSTVTLVGCYEKALNYTGGSPSNTIKANSSTVYLFGCQFRLNNTGSKFYGNFKNLNLNTNVDFSFSVQTPTYTTDQNGIIGLSLGLATHQIISLMSSVGNVILIPFNGGGTYYKVKALSATTMETVANTEMTLTIVFRSK